MFTLLSLEHSSLWLSVSVKEIEVSCEKFSVTFYKFFQSRTINQIRPEDLNFTKLYISFCIKDKHVLHTT